MSDRDQQGDADARKALRGAVLATGLAIGVVALVALVVWLSLDPAFIAPPELVPACKRQMIDRAQHPSTVVFEKRSERIDRGADDGGYRVRVKFAARNAFGTELKFDGECEFGPTNLVARTSVREARPL